MSDLGALLRKAREERGYSLDDIQELTKIRKRYLEAIESGDHSVLPGSFYVRAFVKNYSEAVGLDPDEVLRLYQHEVPAPAVEQTSEPLPVRKPRRMKSQGSDRLGKIGFSLVMWCFLILIVVLVWYFYFNKESGTPDKADDTNITDNAQTPPPTEDTPSQAPATATPTPTPTPPPTTVTFSSKVGQADKYDIGPAGAQHKVELKVVGGRNWVEVRSGNSRGEKLYYANAEDGAVQTYDLTGPIYINVGRADFTEITINGVPVPDGDRSSSKKLLLNPLAAGDEGTAASTPPPSATAPGSITSE
ncbi:helix-turn-helix domain-containing protein [Paenibacillus nanensis]|uniref:Helix-turn-helix domain-containing protein n=1 Tax=Paenibacillus nanensis TaxID=393251 RepID=A0A3A1UWG1_9BACL|nr:RodZ domain-containing protein [Paenibacillus nanensis]RIX51761.1 helix-turn-helix domain-containing protein [Paenibacillus nanensis]